MAMWAGRFEKDLNSRVNAFNESLSFDRRMYKWDIIGSMAHAKMLGETGIIKRNEADNIISGLRGILRDIESGDLGFDDSEDIHMFVESVLTSRIGEDGKRLHTARSRNDQVALDIRMYLREEIYEISSLLLSLIGAVKEKAEDNLDTVMAGYTHLQRAQPVTYAHWILAYAHMFTRDIQRLRETYVRTNIMPLGSGAMASTTYPIDRKMTARLLGFDDITYNSVDGVSDRDFAIELAFDISLIMTHISRFAEEIILFTSSEFGFIDLDDAYSTGSSIMPQKKNPDVAELARGKAGRTYGDLMSLLSMMKGLPLAYDKDMQEDKEAVFDAVDNVRITLEVFRDMYATCTVNKDRLRRSAALGYINATDCADYLVRKGLAFRDAYKIVGAMVGRAVKEHRALEEFTLDELKEFSDRFDGDVYDSLNLDNCVSRRSVIGGPGRESVRYQLDMIDAVIKKGCDDLLPVIGIDY